MYRYIQLKIIDMKIYNMHHLIPKETLASRRYVIFPIL